MTFQLSSWAPVLAFGLVISLVLAALTWKRRRSPGGPWFFLFMIALAWWQLFEILELSAVPLELKVSFARLMYLGVTSIAPLFFIFCFEYREFQVRIPAASRTLLWILPAIVTALAFTNSSHRLVWSDFTPVTGAPLAIYDYVPGPALWLLVGYSYALLLGATIILFSLLASPRKLARRQTIWILLGTLAPWLGNIVYLLNLGPRGVDLTPVSFILSGIFFSLSMFRHRFLNITQVAYGSVFDYMTDAVIVFDTENKVVEANPAAGLLFSVYRKNYGRSLDEVLAPWPDYRTRVEALQTSTGERSLTIPRGPEQLETRFFNLYDARGAIRGYFLIVREITEAKKAEEALKASCQEKVVLLREIQNRVRNNMQIVLSLLNHQAGTMVDPVLRRSFIASRDRIKAISLVQDKLYRSEDLSRIDFAEYTQNLIVHLFHTYQINPNRVRCAFDLCPVLFNVDLSIPLGIIINEVVLNSLKHAFPKERKGEISVKMTKSAAGTYTLLMRDDGVGIPGGIDPAKATTLGFQLIGMLVEQIDGRVDMETSNGVSFEITFPERQKAE